MIKGEFTPTQVKILAVLADGLPHVRDELSACMPDELAKRGSVRMHLYDLRKRLKKRGETIVCEWSYYKIFYRHVRLLRPINEG